MKIRHLMVLVVFVACEMSMLMVALRATGPDRNTVRFVFAIGSPFALAGLSGLIVRPGPHRDWIAGLFVALGYSAVLVFLATLLCARIILNRPVFPNATGGFPVVSLIILALTVAYPVVSIITRYLFPRTCPGCGRRRLVRAIMQSDFPHRKLFAYLCPQCDCRCRLSWAELHKPGGAGFRCPKCGHYPLRKIAYRFFWCLACQARYKRVRRGAWEVIDQPEDEAFYWQANVGGWLSRHIDRLVGKGQAARRE